MQQYPASYQQRPPMPYPYPPQYRRPRRNWRTSCWGCLGGCFILLFLTASMCMVSTMVYVVSPPPTTNILILGVDTRADSGESTAISRTDSIMILSVNPENQKVSLLSIPRDLYINTPTYGYLRVNTVVREAELANEGTGMTELITALENTFGITIDGYTRLNFEAFVDVVNAVGGVKIDVKNRIEDYTYPTEDYGTMYIEFNPGEQKMDGETALIYARTRHGDDDYQRAARQQQVLSALMGKLTNPLNVYRWPAVMVAIWDNIETDMNAGNIITIAPGVALYGNSPDRIERLVIDRDYIMTVGGVPTPNVEAMQTWIDDHMK